MISFLSHLVNGISLGSVYAIIALGYSMVYGIAKMLNFAHGDVIMIGAYISFCVMQYLELPPAVSVVAAMLVCTALGVFIERLAYKPLRQATSLAVLITAIGMSYLLQNAALLIWGANPKVFPSVVNLDSVYLFGGELQIRAETLVTVLANVVIMLALTLFTGKTKMGKAMRAVSEDRGAAELMGINVNLTGRGAAVLGLSRPDPDHRFHAGHQSVYGGGFRRHRLHSRGAGGRRAAGRDRDFGQGLCVHRAGRRAGVCGAHRGAAGQAHGSAGQARA